MKKQIFCTIMCLLGVMFASGGNLAGGLLAIVCFGVAALPHIVTYLKREAKTVSMNRTMRRAA